MEIVLASHSTLARGMYDTASLIMGKSKNLHYITAYLDDSVNFCDQLKETTDEISNQKIVFVTDVVGGSVNNELTKFVAEKPNLFLVSGMNLPFVLELLNYSIAYPDDNLEEIKGKLASLVETGREGLQLVELKDQNEEEDF